jgi:hypothetical protein
MAFLELIYTKLTNALQHYNQILFTDFYPNWTINVANTYAKTLTPLSRVGFDCGDFMKLTVTHYIVIDICCSKVCPSWMKNVEKMGNISFMS